MGIRRFSQLSVLASIVIMSGVFVMFQNCGTGMQGMSGLNSIYGTTLPAVCTGVNCQRDLNTAIVRVGVTGILVDKGSYSAACDSANCFDLGGYCETGGYPASVFTYQWTLAGGSPQAEVQTGETCDENGRFNIQVHVPNGFTWDQTHHTLRISMKVLDENGAQALNPSGAATWTYSVYSRD